MNLALVQFRPDSGSSFLKVLAARFGAQRTIIGKLKIKSRLFWTNFKIGQSNLIPEAIYRFGAVWHDSGYLYD